MHPSREENDQICALRSNLRRLKVKFCTISLRRYCFIILTGAFPLFRSNESYSADYSTLFWQNVKEDKRGEYFILLIFLFPNVTLWKWNSFMSFPFTHAKTTNSDFCAFGLKFISITPWFYLKVKLLAFDKRLVQGQIRFKNEDVTSFPLFLSLLFNMVCVIQVRMMQFK